MARGDEYWTQDAIDAYGNAAVQAAGQDSGGSPRAAGIVLGGVVLIVVMALVCGAPMSIIGKKVEGDTAKAKAQERAAEALVVQASADKIISDAHAEAEIIRAEVDAEVLRTYNELSRTALDADIRRSHPELALKELAGQLCLAVLVLVACITVPCALYFAAQDRTKPGAGKGLVLRGN